jgi:hypothetical protein
MKALIEKYSSIITDYEIITWEIQPTASIIKGQLNRNLWKRKQP